MPELGSSCGDRRMAGCVKDREEGQNQDSKSREYKKLIQGGGVLQTVPIQKAKGTNRQSKQERVHVKE